MLELKIIEETKEKFVADIVRTGESTRKIGEIRLRTYDNGSNEMGELILTGKLIFDTGKGLDELRELFNAVYEYEGGFQSLQKFKL